MKDNCERCDTAVWTTDDSTESWCPACVPDTSHSKGYQAKQCQSIDADYHRARVINNDR